MYKLYTITKEKSKIRGFWKAENGKIYIDKIKIKPFSNYVKFQKGIEKLFSQGEKAVFYEKIGMAFIEAENGSLEKLPYKIAWQEKKLRPSLVKILLALHGGFTVYKNKKGFLIELWKA
jgi:hypothetical protein